MVITVDHSPHGGFLLPRQAPLAGRLPSLCIEFNLPLPMPVARQGQGGMVAAPPLTASFRFSLTGGGMAASAVAGAPPRAPAESPAWPPLRLVRPRLPVWRSPAASRVLAWVRPPGEPRFALTRLPQAANDAAPAPAATLRPRRGLPVPGYLSQQTAAWSQAALRLRTRCRAAMASFRHPPEC